MSDDFTLDEFTQWARSKQRDDRYDYIDNYTCPIAQFLKESGRCNGTPFVQNDEEWYDDAIPVKRGKKPIMHRLPKKRIIVRACAALKPVNTFGHLIQRLETDESDWAFIR
jgi:hypothetical protein